MVREERDASFWRKIASHPDVAPHIGPCTVETWIADARVLPLAGEHGGWIAVQIDALGLVHDLHAMFEPAGRRRESYAVLTGLLSRLFAQGAQIVLATEAGPNPFRAPRSFGFRSPGPTSHTLHGPARAWVLTRDAWARSPAAQRTGVDGSCLSF